ncbi:malto-oligosyltrehalose synthase [Geobacter sp. DSM 9736]|uniref:malto-oligosyltrehalose synthase n=1 Tax=Geobacter sp. DSM 9736 TaxID=1277350 RepID=UPI000B505475|nr:malto-oligosyltrehalose synthase [Geobacter sp. DSM 9736]SNB47349.1 maltooligosyl trehalose synthase [Geobacter sp. DSM 9736]
MERNHFTGLRIPSATYRLQFNGGFGFSAAADTLPYLQELGITDVYAAPFFKAKAGSTHGYDIVDHNVINPEVGFEEDFDLYIRRISELGMGQILDIVPNHMCLESRDNRWWMDVLENGPGSIYNNFFDIEWYPVKHELMNKVLLPILGDQYGAILENQELQLGFEQGSFHLHYWEHRFPLVPQTYSSILSHRLEILAGILSSEHPDYEELLSILTALEHLPSYTERDRHKVAERCREKEIIKRRLDRLYRESPRVREHIDGNVTIFNGEKAVPGSFDLLEKLLRDQVYRISHWRVATEEINYRRFFDINSLGAIRMELQEVFSETHRFLFSLIREGKVTGLRVDHADGLYNPSEYFRNLQSGCFLQLCLKAVQGEEPVQEEQVMRDYYKEVLGMDPKFKPFYIVGEKILTKGEKLPEDWPIFSDTGYGFANLVNALFIDNRNAKAVDAIYSRFTKTRMNFQDVAYEKKKLVMQSSMASEINTLGHHLNTISEKNRHTRDFTLNSLVKALVEVIAFFPVYRTYINSFDVAERDRQYIEYAVLKAKRKNPATNVSIFEFIRDVLMLRFPESIDSHQRREWLDFTMRFQQLTGPVMAKGVEDTAFYVYNRLVSLNEVGGNPERFGITIEAFHGQNIERSKARPHSMLATSTHDTKRSEDVRARIDVLSEIPELWREAVVRWSRFNRKSKVVVEGQAAPDRNEEYLLYQTLLGAWPLDPEKDPGLESFRLRIRTYMLKALREAKVNTSWISPNVLYEDAVLLFVDTILTERAGNQFMGDFGRFQQLSSLCGMYNSLSMTLLKITSPGVPDFYQGTEIWDLSLVDPDNRGQVDYARRKTMLAEIKKQEVRRGQLALVGDLLERWREGGIKLYLLYKALNFRRSSRELFRGGKYLSIEVKGSRHENLCAFERCAGEETVVVLAPRFFVGLTDGGRRPPLGSETWGDTSLVLPFDVPGSIYRNVFTGQEHVVREGEGKPVLPVGEVLSAFPVALLARSGSGRQDC